MSGYGDLAWVASVHLVDGILICSACETPLIVEQLTHRIVCPKCYLKQEQVIDKTLDAVTPADTEAEELVVGQEPTSKKEE